MNNNPPNGFPDFFPEQLDGVQFFQLCCIGRPVGLRAPAKIGPHPLRKIGPDALLDGGRIPSGDGSYISLGCAGFFIRDFLLNIIR